MKKENDQMKTFKTSKSLSQKKLSAMHNPSRSTIAAGTLVICSLGGVSRLVMRGSLRLKS